MNRDIQDRLESARNRVATQVAQAEARNHSIASLADDLANLSVTARSPRGELTISAKPTGQITSVTFSTAAETLSASALSELVTRTLTEAQHLAAMAAVQRAAETLGDNAPFVTQLRNEAETAFPDTSSDTIKYR